MTISAPTPAPGPVRARTPASLRAAAARTWATQTNRSRSPRWQPLPRRGPRPVSRSRQETRSEFPPADPITGRPLRTGPGRQQPSLDPTGTW